MVLSLSLSVVIFYILYYYFNSLCVRIAGRSRDPPRVPTERRELSGAEMCTALWPLVLTLKQIGKREAVGCLIHDFI